MSLRPLAYWDCGFEAHRGHECLPHVNAGCYQVQFSVRTDHSSRGVVPSVMYLTKCDGEALTMGDLGPLWAVKP